MKLSDHVLVKIAEFVFLDLINMIHFDIRFR